MGSVLNYQNKLVSFEFIKVMNCPRCGCINHCKNGVIKGRQRYKCKDCKYYYTVERKSDIKSKQVKCQAFELYLEGLGFRAIGRFLYIRGLVVN
jgi:transposase-like protein